MNRSLPKDFPLMRAVALATILVCTAKPGVAQDEVDRTVLPIANPPAAECCDILPSCND